MREYLTITNEDNMDLMARYPDNHFDLAIVDPPYGIGVFTSEKNTSSKGIRKKNKKIYTDDYKWNEEIPSEKYFKELQRVSKKRVIWGSNYYPIVDGTGGSLIWYKGRTTNKVSHAEIASLSFQTKVDYTHINWQSGFYRKVKEGQQIHPCQKPVQLYKWLLTNYAKEGDKILDTHLGSGSIAIAVDSVNKIEKMNLTLTACELDVDYFNSATKRIEEQTKWNSLF